MGQKTNRRRNQSSFDGDFGLTTSHKRRRAAACAGPFPSLLNGIPQSILHAANGILDFAGGLLGLAVRLHLGIADHFADHLLDRAFDLMCGSRDPIFIHVYYSKLAEVKPTV